MPEKQDNRTKWQQMRTRRLSHTVATLTAGTMLAMTGVAVTAGPSTAAPLHEATTLTANAGLNTALKGAQVTAKKRTYKKRTYKKRRYTKRTTAPAASGTAGRAYAQSVLDPTQFACLDKLFAKESGWRTNASNRSSGAYGIPQALPGSKMASAGADWRTNPVTQVKWGLSYIKARHGTPCNAWAHAARKNWY